MLDWPHMGFRAPGAEFTVLRHGGTGLVPGAVARSPQLAEGGGWLSRALTVRSSLALARGAPALLNRVLPAQFTRSRGRLAQAATSASSFTTPTEAEEPPHRGCATAPPLLRPPLGG